MTCKTGECRGSACDFYPGILEPCNCLVDSETATEEEMKQHCHVCCQSVGKPDTCKSTGELFQYFKDDSGKNRTIYRQPGSPCDDYKGYCDVFSKCRSVDADGPLAKLKKALFNPVLYSNIKEWIVVSICKFGYLMDILIKILTIKLVCRLIYFESLIESEFLDFLGF